MDFYTSFFVRYCSFVFAKGTFRWLVNDKAYLVCSEIVKAMKIASKCFCCIILCDCRETTKGRIYSSTFCCDIVNVIYFTFSYSSEAMMNGPIAFPSLLTFLMSGPQR